MRSTSTLTCERVRLTRFLVNSSVSFGSPISDRRRIQAGDAARDAPRVLHRETSQGGFDFFFYFLTYRINGALYCPQKLDMCVEINYWSLHIWLLGFLFKKKRKKSISFLHILPYYIYHELE